MSRAPRQNKSHKGGNLQRKSPRRAARHDDWLYGRHAVLAALANPRRQVDSLLATSNAAQDFKRACHQKGLSLQLASMAELSALLPPGAVHQGIAANVKPLAELSLEELAPDRPVLVLDQVTDPHNVGAIMRSAAVFNASALIMTRRNSPPLSGVLAKSACGALEHVHMVFVSNLARALKQLEELGFWRIGLDGKAETALEHSVRTNRTSRSIALVLGAEDKGMRRLTMAQCDELCHITTSGPLISLNVSNAAAIALHLISQI